MLPTALYCEATFCHPYQNPRPHSSSCSTLLRGYLSSTCPTLTTTLAHLYAAARQKDLRLTELAVRAGADSHHHVFRQVDDHRHGGRAVPHVHEPEVN